MNRLLVILPTVTLLALGCATTPTVKHDRNDPKTKLFYDQMPRPLTEIILINSDEKVLYRIRGRDLLPELDRIVEFKSGNKFSMHGCPGDVYIQFAKRRRIYTTWKLVHGSFNGDWFTPKAEQRLAAWLASKGVTEFQQWPVPEGSFGGRYKLHDAFRYLQLAQTSDGSWGAGAEQYMTTTYVLLAFLHFGHTLDDKQYGTCIANGFKWLNDNKPTSASERALAAHLLLNAYQMTEAPAPNLGPSIEKLLAELAADSPPQLYLDLLALTSFPKENQRPAWIPRPDEALSRLRREPDDRILRSSDDFLRFSLITIARFQHCGQCWREFRLNKLNPMLESLQRDGRYLLPGHSPVRSTAQFLVTFGIYYRYTPFLQEIEKRTTGRNWAQRTRHH